MMRSSLGVSTGNEVVCSALMITTSNGVQSTEYRVISADEATADLGDLVASSIELMTTQVSRDNIQPDGIAVAYRTREQTQSIRSAVGSQRRDLQLVPESAAALAYLRHTGLVSRYQTVAIVDLGATGLTVTVIDQTDGSVLESARTSLVSGDAIDNLVLTELLDRHYEIERGWRPNKSLLVARAHAAKEHLSTNDAVTIDHVGGRPLQLTRDDFEWLIGDQIREAGVFAATTFANAARQPEIVALIGGGANIPSLRSGLARNLGIRVTMVDEPEAVIAKGAALIADSSQPGNYPVVSLAADAPVGTFTKVAGVLLGVVVVVGLIVGYGVEALTPSKDGDVSPAGTSNEQSTPPPAPAPATTLPPPLPTTQARQKPADELSPSSVPTITYDHTTAELPTTTVEAEVDPSGSNTTTPPTLRPGPDLPQIPWPQIQQWLPQTGTGDPSATQGGAAGP